jgi:hypothetical protein
VLFNDDRDKDDASGDLLYQILLLCASATLEKKILSNNKPTVLLSKLSAFLQVIPNIFIILSYYISTVHQEVCLYRGHRHYSNSTSLIHSGIRHAGVVDGYTVYCTTYLQVCPVYTMYSTSRPPPSMCYSE